MSPKVLAISTSPRIGGNTELLLTEALAGAESAGAQIELLRLRSFRIAPCVACGGCEKTGQCIIEDDYPKLLAKLLEADRLIFGIPVFFMSVCAQAKILIDRGQCLWVRKYRLKKGSPAEPRGQEAMVIAVGGSRSKRQFDSVQLTMRCYFDSLGAQYFSNLFVSKVDARGDVRSRPDALRAARDLGKEFVQAPAAAKEPKTVALL